MPRSALHLLPLMMGCDCSARRVLDGGVLDAGDDDVDSGETPDSGDDGGRDAAADAALPCEERAEACNARDDDCDARRDDDAHLDCFGDDACACEGEGCGAFDLSRSEAVVADAEGVIRLAAGQSRGTFRRIVDRGVACPGNWNDDVVIASEVETPAGSGIWVLVAWAATEAEVSSEGIEEIAFAVRAGDPPIDLSGGGYGGYERWLRVDFDLWSEEGGIPGIVAASIGSCCLSEF